MAPKASKNSSACTCRRLCVWAPLSAILIVLVSILIPLYSSYSSLAPDESFALIRSHTYENSPTAAASRYRGPEYSSYDRFFFQWWNFLIVDSDTGDHWNLIYQATNFSSKSSEKDEIYSAFLHGRGADRLLAGKFMQPLEKAKFSNHFDLSIEIPSEWKENLPQGENEEFQPKSFELTVLNDHQYRIQAAFHRQLIDQQIPVTWDFTFTRVHGIFTGGGSEDSNKDFCLIVSYLFAYNSLVVGRIREGDQVYYINSSPEQASLPSSEIPANPRDSRYRAYAAGSYGCQLPNGRPASQFPWTWFWLVIPNEDPEKEISLQMGSAKFQTGFPLGNLYGASALMGIGKNQYFSAQSGTIFYNTSYSLPFQSSTSDSYIKSFSIETSQWEIFEDFYGKAEIPLQQIYSIETKSYNIYIHWTTELKQYFRAPVPVEDMKSGDLRVFSDFRAVGVQGELSIQEKILINGEFQWKTHYSGPISRFNALEYAYEPEMNIELFQTMTKGGGKS